MLKYIEIEEGINLENKWVKTFIQIGQIWETWSDEIGGEISGYLNMYGVNLESTFVIDANEYKVNVYKKYTNTGYRSGAYSCITTVDINLMDQTLFGDFNIVRANWLRRTTRFITRFSHTDIYDGFLFKAVTLDLIKKIKASNVHKIPDFGWMKCEEGTVTFRFYSSPNTVEQVSSYIRGMNQVLKTTAKIH